MKTAWLFTGQGFQYPGMLHQLPDCTMVRHRLHLANNILGYNVLDTDTPDKLKSNLHTQICIYLSESILAELLQEHQTCQTVSGHSIGSFAAAVSAGVLTYEDGLHMVFKRGQEMERLFANGYGMLAVHGLSCSLSEQMSDTFNKKESNFVYLAIINEEQQCVFTGEMKALKKFESYLHTLFPVKTQFLHVKVPSHCSLMHPITKLLTAESSKLVWHFPNIPVMLNSTARFTLNPEKIKKDLVSGAESMIHWYDGITIMKELGIEHFIEISQTDNLTKIGRRCYPKLDWQNYPLL